MYSTKRKYKYEMIKRNQFMYPTFAIYSLQSPHGHLVGIQVLIFDLKISTDGEFLKSLGTMS